MRRHEAERLARRLEQAAPGARPGPQDDLGARHGVRPTDDAHDARDAHDELSGLVSLAQTLEASAAEPSPRFKTALRERVLATGAEEPPQPAWRAHLDGVIADTVAAWRYSVSSQVASGALTAVMLLAALFIGAGLSVPGDPLYALKGAYQQAQLSRASAPVDVASVQLSMAATKIEETVRAAERDRPDSLVSSAADAEQLVRDSSEALLEVHRDTGDEAVLAPVPAFVDRYRPTVRELQEHTTDVDARRALANLMITMDRADARVATALDECCAPDQEASAFWVMSSPHRMLRECPCADDAALADDQPDDGGDETDSGAPALQSAPVPDTGGADDAPEHERLREDMREGWDKTREGVRDTVDGIVDGVDDLPTPSDDTTDQLREELDDATDGVDETLDETRDAVDDITEGVQEALPDASDSQDGSLGDQFDAEGQSAEGTGSRSNDDDGGDGDGGGEAGPSLEGAREEDADADADADADVDDGEGDGEGDGDGDGDLLP